MGRQLDVFDSRAFDESILNRYNKRRYNVQKVNVQFGSRIRNSDIGKYKTRQFVLS
jgi:hypothetical protein